MAAFKQKSGAMGCWKPGLSVWEVLDKGRKLSPAELAKLGIPDEVPAYLQGNARRRGVGEWLSDISV